MKVKSLFYLILLIIAAMLAAGCASVQNETPAPSAPSQDAAAPDISDAIHIQIEVRDYGTIQADLYPHVAPVTVDNFVSLINEGFYNGLTFHRVIESFMIQGGDPLGNGRGGSDESITGEFSNNGFENMLSHGPGVLSMARAGNDNDSASSQFFIVHTDAAFLDGDYAAFGMVTKGMDVIDAIAENTPVEDENGTVLSENQPVIESIIVIE